MRLASALLASLAAVVQADLITNLPGWNGTAFKQYSGYVNVDAASGRNLFYWFTESQRSPTNDPLVLWLNGGPGCSSVGGGLLSELGPFYPDSTGTKLVPNPYSWNTVANVLFVESPAGVGFSYSNNQSDYTVGDERSALDLWTLLQGFLQQFPQYTNTPFWISGESYGGHYVPTTALRIVNENAAIDRQIAAGLTPTAQKINLQGFLVGNAWTVAEIDNFGAAFFWWTHALVSDATFEGLSKTCNFSTIGPLSVTDSAAKRSSPTTRAMQAMLDSLRASETDDNNCNNYQLLADDEMGNVNIYDVYVDVCATSDGELRYASHEAQTLMKALGRPMPGAKALKKANEERRARRMSGSNSASGASIVYDPCIDNEVNTYLNIPAVQKAIHANTNLGYPWTVCSSLVNYSRDDLLSSMIPVYQQLIAANLRMLVYSGDVDGIVPVTGTRAWLDQLSAASTTNTWRPYTVSGQVGGYVEERQGLTFATVRNAGHMVPYTQQERALHIFSNFIAGNPL